MGVAASGRVRSWTLPLAGLGLALLARSAAAHPSLTAGDHPLHRLAARERDPNAGVRAAVAARGRFFRAPRPPRPPGPTPDGPVLDLVHARYDVHLDPESSLVEEHVSFELRANGQDLGGLGLAFDSGLAVVTASAASGRRIQVQSGIQGQLAIAELDFAPALGPGERDTVELDIRGTLACIRDPQLGSVSCTKGRDFAYIAREAIFGYVFDPASSEDVRYDGLTQDTIVHVPAGDDVIATGEKVSESIEGDEKVSTWTIAHPLTRNLGMYIFAGHLGLASIPDRAIPTTLVFEKPRGGNDDLLVSWSGAVLAFAEHAAGRPLPFPLSLSLVHLPSDLGDPGTATYAMTLLSNDYASAGDLIYEETWAHENSHLFWGITVPELDISESRILSEGLATLTEIDYTYAHHFASEDRDLYLARRFVPIGIELAHTEGAASLPPVEVPSGTPFPPGVLYTLWAYEKSAAALDHLRATIGDEVFGLGLARYVERCSFVGCRVDDLKLAMEDASQKNLTAFFERWISASSRPEVTVAFEPTARGADVTLAKADDRPMTLAIWSTLEDGRRLERRVDLTGAETKVAIEAPAAVRSVAISPRHDLFVAAKPAIAGDLDFDGETDGFDVLACAHLAGARFTSLGRLPGLWDVDETFDRRCDTNDDLVIDDRDLEQITAHFGVLRTP
jgi:peptidase M1-like protein